MHIRHLLILFLIFATAAQHEAGAQRIYKPNSVLNSGNWYKLAVKETGIYRVDVAFLNVLGINTSSLSSNSIRLYGNGGFMLPESNAQLRMDDLEENAIQVFDGGDGVFNGNDYFLFYATGPDEWIKDSTNKKFNHRKNLYASQSYYFLSISGIGKRISTSNVSTPANVFVNSFNERYFKELDSINLLASGKEWYGEEFGKAPGKTITRSFSITLPNIIASVPLELTSNVIARSAGSSSRFDISADNNLVQQHFINSVGTGQYDAVAIPSQQTSFFNTTQSNFTLTFTYVSSSTNAQAWLNWYEINGRRGLSMSGAGQQLTFRDWNSVAAGNIGEFTIQGASSTTDVWEVTNPLQPIKMNGIITGNNLKFTNDCASLKEYIAFNNTNFLSPLFVAKVDNQDLHNYTYADMIIVAYPEFLAEAQRLAAHHFEKEGLRSVVTTTEKVYNEFASGTPDPTSVRDFVKLYYDKANGDSSKMPKYLLLFGDASYDYQSRLKNNTNFVPAYESSNSLDPLVTHTSDDFFGFLNDNEDININFPINLLDIGIGRIPAKNVTEAKNAVDKIIHYTQKESLGPWRNDITFVADDEDANLHLGDAEILSGTVNTVASGINQQKIYMDAYRQQSGSGGSRYPEVNQAITNKIFSGTLVWNYSGHGGATRLAEEAILDQDLVNQWNNTNKLPLFITATCDFAPYDNPNLNSLGEDILLREKNGAIALMTTTRLVFAFSNRIINTNYLYYAFQPKLNKKYRSLGEAVQVAKNFTYTNFPDIINNRKFTLLGDPALTLGFPSLKVKTTAINGNTGGSDTLKALNKYVVLGEVTDLNDMPITNFNGTVYATIFDKAQQVKTLGNDPQSPVTSFNQETNILYKGKVKVVNGKFAYTFIVPKDINYQYGNGKISYYADNTVTDAAGFDKNIVIGGAGTGSIADNEGPGIKAFLNDEKFVNGGLTNATPVLIVKLSDSSGINTVGTGIGHDIIATIDDDNDRFFVLNDFYEAEFDSYQKGVIRFPLPEMLEGLHTLTIKAWDVANNSSTYVLTFRVVKNESLTIEHVLNYPNPFTTHTQFWFEHNRPGDNMLVTIRIMTITGKVVKSISQTINTTGNRSCEIEWDGRDDYGDKVARGVYLYSLEVKTSDGKKVRKLEKLVLL
ncbi:MAG TPA: type IX secretion system sortase PorU [Chitinophagaceae bacterium]|nr:type IX secretion system sortase PorU [Chitinophagaceae bacterium]